MVEKAPLRVADGLAMAAMPLDPFDEKREQ
jgi:hypothetical protein